MRKKLVPLFAIAFVVAVISTAVFYSLFATRLNGSPATRGPQSSVVIATRDLTPGTVLSAQDVRVITWTGDQPPAGVYSATEQVVGKTVFQPVSRGEPLTELRLAAKDGTGIGVPEGMRAVSVHVSDSSGVVALLKPGYKVDVQMFERPQAAPGKTQLTTLLRGASVLAVSTQAEPSSQAYFTAPVVTLLASARDAEQLALADSFARLRLALRNPLEPAAEPPPPNRAPRDQSAGPPKPAIDVRLRAISLTDEGLAALAGLIDPRIQSSAMNVTLAPSSVDFASLTGLLRSGDWTEARPESLIPASPASWFQMNRENARLRIGLAPLGGQTLRVRSELTGTLRGHSQIYSVETAFEVVPGRVIVISGLDPNEPPAKDSRLRHLVVMITPQPRPGPKTTG